MHRQPKKREHPHGITAPRGEPRDVAAAREYHKGVVEPWLVTGGSSFFLRGFTRPNLTPPIDVRARGVQLVCAVYIPKGSVGFLKQIRVAPFRPSVFMPGFYAAGNNQFATWIEFNTQSAQTNDPQRPAGVWEAPFQWENYFDAYDENAVPPSWRWYLRVISGNIDELRAHKNNLPAPIDPDIIYPPVDWFTSWFLSPDVAVPAEVYPNGLPGSPVGSPWDGQRMQVIQGDELSCHLPIPENSTLCLFTRWSQQPIEACLGTSGQNSHDAIVNYTTEKYYPLLPSCGSLLGYSQASHLPAAKENAELGWHG